jgi:hypothetical protein
MNATQQMLLAAALADALEKAGIVVERADVSRGNVKGWQRIDSGAVAARTIGTWMSWGFAISCVPSLAPPAEPAPTSTDSAQRALRLVDDDSA